MKKIAIWVFLGSIGALAINLSYPKSIFYKELWKECFRKISDR